MVPFLFFRNGGGPLCVCQALFYKKISALSVKHTTVCQSKDLIHRLPVFDIVINKIFRYVDIILCSRSTEPILIRCLLCAIIICRGNRKGIPGIYTILLCQKSQNHRNIVIFFYHRSSLILPDCCIGNNLPEQFSVFMQIRMGRIMGYYAGHTLANKLGISMQVPVKEEITSNNMAAIVREVSVGDRGYIVRKALYTFNGK